MNLMYSPTMMLTSSILVTSTLMAMSSANWILLWGAMELNLLSFIPILMQTSTNQETEGSVKYFLAQAMGSALLLMSSTSMWMPFSSIPNTMSLLLIMAIMLKLGSVPCHFWYPSVMSSVSWTSCLILSTWQKLAPISIMAFILPLKNTSFIMYMAGLNALVGGFMGMNQNQLRTVMAYSSIGHIGWMLSLMAIYKPSASITYFLVYSILITPLFTLMNYFNIRSIKQMNKISSNNTLMHLTLLLLFLSLGGLPPLTGFMPKLMSMMLIVESMNLVLFMLVIGSVMNLFFYLNICINMLTSSPYMPPLKAIKNLMSPIFVSVAILSLGMSPIIMMYAMTLLN